MRLRMVLFLLLVVLLAACSTPHKLPEAPTPIPRLEPATLPPSEAPAEQPASSTGDAPPAAPAGEADVAAGEEVFNSKCAVCHNLNDQLKVGPGLKGLFDRVSLPNGDSFSEAALRNWILNGGGQMVGIPLDDTELNDLVAYLEEATQ